MTLERSSRRSGGRRTQGGADVSVGDVALATPRILRPRTTPSPSRSASLSRNYSAVDSAPYKFPPLSPPRARQKNGEAELVQHDYPGGRSRALPLTGHDYLDHKFRSLAEMTVTEQLNKLEASLESRSALTAAALASRVDELSQAVKELRLQAEKPHSPPKVKAEEVQAEEKEGTGSEVTLALEHKFQGELSLLRKDVMESVKKMIPRTAQASESLTQSLEEKVVAVTAEILPKLEHSIDERFAKLWKEADRLGAALDPKHLSQALDSAPVKAWVSKAVHEVLLSPHELAIALDRARGHKEQLNLTALVMKVVREQLEVFAADEIGLPDLALYSGGGRIVHGSGWTAPSFLPTNKRPLQMLPPGALVHERAWSMFKHYMISIPLHYVVLARNYLTLAFLGYTQSTHAPEVILQAHHDRGQCWPMAGQSGYVTIRLPERAVIEAFSIQHLEPTVIVSADTAPKDIRVEALGDFPTAGTKGEVIARHTYLPSNGKVQTFYVDTTLTPALRTNRFLRLWVDSNHGNKLYTCIYRFRVHGKPALSIDTQASG
eukprot:tig00021352_g20713.t1